VEKFLQPMHAAEHKLFACRHKFVIGRDRGRGFASPRRDAARYFTMIKRRARQPEMAGCNAISRLPAAPAKL